MNTLISVTGVSTTVYTFGQKIAEAHRLLMKELTLNTETHRFQLQQTRGTPVLNGLSRGKQKSVLKTTMDIDVPNSEGSGNIVDSMILNLDGSCPVGASDADVDLFLDLQAALISSPEYRAQFKSGDLADA